MAVVFFAVPDPLVPWSFVLYLLSTVLSGVFTGAVGIGGVLVVPLMLLLDVPVLVALPSVYPPFFVAAVIATIFYARKGSIQLRPAVILCLAAAPAAAVASFVVHKFPTEVVSVVVAFWALFAGLRTLWRECSHNRPPVKSVTDVSVRNNCSRDKLNEEEADKLVAEVPDKPGDGPKQATTAPHKDDKQVASVHHRDAVYAFCGLVAGFCSVITATGGPFIFLPVLLAFYPNYPTLAAVGLAQAISVVICGVAGVVSCAHPDIKVDLGIGLCLTVTLMVGTPIGVVLAHRVGPYKLKIAIAMVLIAVGISSGIKVTLAILEGKD